MIALCLSCYRGEIRVFVTRPVGILLYCVLIRSTNADPIISGEILRTLGTNSRAGDGDQCWRLRRASLMGLRTVPVTSTASHFPFVCQVILQHISIATASCHVISIS